MVTKEEVQRIAALSKLYVEPSDLEGLTKDMEQLVEFASMIQEAQANSAGGQDTGCVQPLCTAYREDIVEPSIDRSLLLQNVGGGQEGFFRVEKSRQEEKMCQAK